MILDIQPGATHDKARNDTTLSVPVNSGPPAVAVVPELGFAFWLQPAEWASYGDHGAPGELVLVELDQDGCFRLEGCCEGWNTCRDDTVGYFGRELTDMQVGFVERCLRGFE